MLVACARDPMRMKLQIRMKDFAVLQSYENLVMFENFLVRRMQHLRSKIPHSGVLPRCKGCCCLHGAQDTS